MSQYKKAVLIFILLLIFLIECVSFAVLKCNNQRCGRDRNTHACLHLSLSQAHSERLIIHWKGEVMEGYSFHFRQAEFEGALEAIVGKKVELTYKNAITFREKDQISEIQRLYYDNSMQFVTGIDNLQHAIEAVQRCSLVHSIYKVVAWGENYTDCTEYAIENGGFADMYAGSESQEDTWCVRVRQYGNPGTKVKRTGAKVKRHGERARSMQEEKKALLALEPLLLRFGGRVDLNHPDCFVYFFNGLNDRKTVLARRLAKGPPAFAIAPNTRICVTTTPLCPIAAYNLCNIAGVKSGLSILDPFAGSCTVLLAAAMIAPECRTVAIEIAHNGLVNRDNIIQDFESRNLTLPLGFVQGDSTEDCIRDLAREKINGNSFDLIITDPPYGIRESTNYNDEEPLTELLQSIGKDREAGKPLLKKGGRLVAFVPCVEQPIEECLPTKEVINYAGLKLLDKREQPLNEKLSRWLVSFSCTK